MYTTFFMISRRNPSHRLLVFLFFYKCFLLFEYSVLALSHTVIAVNVPNPKSVSLFHLFFPMACNTWPLFNIFVNFFF